jgi:hypothetical protein
MEILLCHGGVFGSLLCIWKIQGLNICLKNGDTEIFHGFVSPATQMQQYSKLLLFLYQLLRNSEIHLL